MPRRRSNRAPYGTSAWDSVHPRLDLHGHTGDQARLEAEAWLRGHAVRGTRVVVVVTGRGKHSPGERPVLRGEIETLLHDLLASIVREWELDPAGGAFRIALCHRRPPLPSLRATPDRAAGTTPDAALRARAEAALWELGIRPTPELITAEIRKIQRAGGGP